jgi:hypothetical protein
LNATGASDIRFFYDKVKAEQQRALMRPIRHVVEVAAKAIGIELPENWSVRFKPLWQMTDSERATYKKTVLEGTQIAINTGMIAPEEAATSHYGGDQFSEEIHLSTEDREALAEAQQERDQEAAQANAEALAAAAPAPAPEVAPPAVPAPPDGG